MNTVKWVANFSVWAVASIAILAIVAFVLLSACRSDMSLKAEKMDLNHSAQLGPEIGLGEKTTPTKE